MSRSSGPRSAAHSSEVPFLLFLFHGADLVMINQAALALGRAGAESFGDDTVDIGGVGFDSGGKRVATERAEADTAARDLLVLTDLQAIVVHDEQLSIAHDRRTLLGEIERHDVELFAQDVAPDV